jgi:hypothetical protein
MPIQGQLTKRGAALALDYVTGRAFQKVSSHSTYLMLMTGTMANDSFTVANAAAVEVVSTGYARQAVTWGVPAIPTDGSSTSITAFNSAAINFGPFTAVGGMSVPAVAACLVQVSTGTTGDAIAYWELDNPALAAQGETLTAAINTGLLLSLE